MHNKNVKESIVNLEKQKVFLLSSIHYISSVCIICVHEEWLNKIAPTLANEVHEVRLYIDLQHSSVSSEVWGNFILKAVKAEVNKYPWVLANQSDEVIMLQGTNTRVVQQELWAHLRALPHSNSWLFQAQHRGTREQSLSVVVSMAGWDS